MSDYLMRLVTDPDEKFGLRGEGQELDEAMERAFERGLVAEIPDGDQPVREITKDGYLTMVALVGYVDAASLIPLVAALHADDPASVLMGLADAPGAMLHVATTVGEEASGA